VEINTQLIEMETVTAPKPDLKKSFTFDNYIELIEDLIGKGRTTGPKQTEALIKYTEQNLFRMKRHYKHDPMNPELESLLESWTRPLLFVVISEAWCGDAAHNLGGIARFLQLTNTISLKILLRDENPEYMDAYLTNGGRAIPKVIIYDPASMNVLAQWGPRPKPAQEMFNDFKRIGNGSRTDFDNRLHLWYGRDNNKTLQREFLELFKKLAG
jgi:hypothetical protein